MIFHNIKVVKNEKRELREKFQPRPLSHSHTADQSQHEVGVMSDCFRNNKHVESTCFLRKHLFLPSDSLCCWVSWQVTVSPPSFNLWNSMKTLGGLCVFTHMHPLVHLILTTRGPACYIALQLHTVPLKDMKQR